MCGNDLFEEQRLPLPSEAAWIPEGEDALFQAGMKAAVCEMEHEGKSPGVDASVVAADVGREIVAVGPMAADT